MISFPVIVSLNVQINIDGIIYPGIALAEKYPDGNIIILERTYKKITELQISMAVINYKESIVKIIPDWGESYEKNVPDKQV